MFTYDGGWGYYADHTRGQVPCVSRDGFKNMSNVWNIPVSHTKSKHTCTFPEELVRRCLEPTLPVYVCHQCGAPFVRVGPTTYEVIPSCKHAAIEYRRPIVLDPFGGSMTTGVVAQKMGAAFLGLETNTKIAREGAERMGCSDWCF